MPEYMVKKTDILHNKVLYPEGKTIELTEEQAQVLADYLELIPEIEKIQKPAKEAQKKSKNTNETEGGEN